MSDNEVKSISDFVLAGKYKPYEGVYLDACGDIVFKLPTGSIYEIEKKRCNTLPKIIAWVMHMADKNWVTVEALQTFIYLAMKINDLGNAYDGDTNYF